MKKIKNECNLPDLPTKSIKIFDKTLRLVSNTKDSINFSAENIHNSQVYVNCSFNGEQASQMKNNIPDLINEEQESVYSKQLFKWEQANLNNSKKSGNMGLIEGI